MIAFQTLYHIIFILMLELSRIKLVSLSQKINSQYSWLDQKDSNQAKK